MKKSILLFAGLAIAFTASAQRARQEIRQNVNLAAANYLAYPTPTKALTPAPKGYEPFYISHYGRHGSRWQIGKNAFNRPYNTLAKADSLGKLTAKGKEVLRLVKAMRDEGLSREGELTLLGAQQHRAIARRMFERFPQVFAGKVHVDGKSTVIIRSILSMENELIQLAELNPQLDITHDASHHDMYYMNSENTETRYTRARYNKDVRDSLGAFYAKHSDVTHFMSVMFNDPEYAKTVKGGDLADQVMSTCKALQNTELRHRFAPIWDVFTEQEIYNSWLCNNAYWYCVSGPNRITDGAGMYMQLELLKHILTVADSCVQLPHPGASLRFAHESTVLPFVCLMNINGMGNPRSGLDNLDKEDWVNYRVFPMACNVQFVFYKPTKGKGDILVKVLLNENEATIPVKTDKAPYYHWKDVKAYMQHILDTHPMI